MTVPIHADVPECAYAVCEAVGDHPCTPESTAACCDAYGRFSTTDSFCSVHAQYQVLLGYCTKGGECAAHTCKSALLTTTPQNAFCGVSKINPCKASCMISGVCRDTATFLDGGDPLQDGAICLKDNYRGSRV